MPPLGPHINTHVCPTCCGDTHSSATRGGHPGNRCHLHRWDGPRCVPAAGEGSAARPDHPPPPSDVPTHVDAGWAGRDTLVPSGSAGTRGLLGGRFPYKFSNVMSSESSSAGPSSWYPDITGSEGPSRGSWGEKTAVELGASKGSGTKSAPKEF